MGWKAAIQMVGLVRGEPKQGQKHRANGKDILIEMGKERISKSSTLDETRSHLNAYNGISDSGFECWDYLEDRANNYKLTGKTKDGKDFKYSLRKDAVIGCALIFNPPEEICCNWDAKTYQKFYGDSWSFLKQTEPRLFRDENIVLDAEHVDEGLDSDGKSKHLHRAIEARDKNDRYCGNLVDAKLLADINKTYPAYMRSCGWDMDDLDVTDWDRYKTDLEYRTERKQKAKNAGLSVNAYGKKMSAKEAKKQSLERVKFVESVEALKQQMENANSKMKLATAMYDGLDFERKELEKEKQEFEKEKALQDEKVREKVEHEVERERVKMQSELEHERMQMQQEVNEQKEALEREREALKQQKEALKQERMQTQQLFSKRIREVNAYKNELKRTMDEVNAFVQQDRSDAVNYGLETWCKHLKYQNGTSVYDKYLADKESRQQRAKDTSDLVNEILSNGNYDIDYQK